MAVGVTELCVMCHIQTLNHNCLANETLSEIRYLAAGFFRFHEFAGFVLFVFFALEVFQPLE